MSLWLRNRPEIQYACATDSILDLLGECHVISQKDVCFGAVALNRLVRDYLTADNINITAPSYGQPSGLAVVDYLPYQYKLINRAIDTRLLHRR